MSRWLSPELYAAHRAYFRRRHRVRAVVTPLPASVVAFAAAARARAVRDHAALAVAPSGASRQAEIARPEPPLAA